MATRKQTDFLHWSQFHTMRDSHIDIYSSSIGLQDDLPPWVRSRHVSTVYLSLLSWLWSRTVSCGMRSEHGLKRDVSRGCPWYAIRSQRHFWSGHRQDCWLTSAKMHRSWGGLFDVEDLVYWKIVPFLYSTEERMCERTRSHDRPNMYANRVVSRHETTCESFDHLQQ